MKRIRGARATTAVPQLVASLPRPLPVATAGAASISRRVGTVSTSRSPQLAPQPAQPSHHQAQLQQRRMCSPPSRAVVRPPSPCSVGNFSTRTTTVKTKCQSDGSSDFLLSQQRSVSSSSAASSFSSSSSSSPSSSSVAAAMTTTTGRGSSSGRPTVISVVNRLNAPTTAATTARRYAVAVGGGGRRHSVNGQTSAHAPETGKATTAADKKKTKKKKDFAAEAGQNLEDDHVDEIDWEEAPSGKEAEEVATANEEDDVAEILDEVHEADASTAESLESTRAEGEENIAAAAQQSAKLAALHARLQLPQAVPLESLARCLVDSTADASAPFNNAQAAFLGRSIISFHVTEWLMARYPRLPMEILFAAMKGLAGPRALQDIAMGWGVEAAACPGPEVDPGLLQYDVRATNGWRFDTMGHKRYDTDSAEQFKYRRGIASRVVLDDEFGDTVSMGEHERELKRRRLQERAQQGLLSDEELLQLEEAQPVRIEIGEGRRLEAYAGFVRAVVGVLFLHCGREAARRFVAAHVLSRRLPLERMFAFTRPARELVKLCQREGFEPPKARILSESGRLSVAPVFVVGIYSGKDRLSEGFGSNLNDARLSAVMNGLKAWYLYSPGENVRLPSETYDPCAKPWEPLYIDMGEVVI